METSDVKNLEDALNKARESPEKVSEEPKQMTKEEEIAFHKGALNTLVGERNELVKVVRNVEAIMQAHLSRLKELGVDIK